MEKLEPEVCGVVFIVDPAPTISSKETTADPRAKTASTRYAKLFWTIAVETIGKSARCRYGLIKLIEIYTCNRCVGIAQPLLVSSGTI
jgi:hypothetical protein